MQTSTQGKALQLGGMGSEELAAQVEALLLGRCGLKVSKLVALPCMRLESKACERSAWDGAPKQGWALACSFRSWCAHWLVNVSPDDPPDRLLAPLIRPHQVRFDSEEAMSELSRLGLGSSEAALLPLPLPVAPPAHAPSSTSSLARAEAQAEGEQKAGHLSQPQQQQQQQYTDVEHVPQVYCEVVGLSEAVRVVQGHWDGLLWTRVDSILREFE